MKNYEKCKAYKIKEPANGICEGENRKKCLNCPACIRYRETLERKIEELDERLGIVLEGQPEIVRCKDCRWWHESEIHKGFGDCGQANGIAFKTSDWYCADGERRGRMTDEERVLLIGIFLAVFFTFAIAAGFCLE